MEDNCLVVKVHQQAVFRSVICFYGSGSSDPYPDFTDPDTDPYPSYSDFSYAQFLIHTLLKKKVSSSRIKSSSDPREKICVPNTSHKQFHNIIVLKSRKIRIRNKL
jgi:hypothetical protein